MAKCFAFYVFSTDYCKRKISYYSTEGKPVKFSLVNVLLSNLSSNVILGEYLPPF